jgi:hypothetical protein
VAAQAFVDKDVPPDSIAYGHNRVQPLEDRHRKYLGMLFHLSIHVYGLVPGLVYADGDLWVDPAWARSRERLLREFS